MTTQNASLEPVQPLSPLKGWRNALGVTVLGCLIIGLANFMLLAGYLAKAVKDLQLAALLLDIGFAIGMAIILGLIVFWQRSHGETLAELGWRKPTTPLAIILGVVVGVLWLALSYLGAMHLLPHSNFFAITWIRIVMALLGIFIATAEEIMMRGFFMTQLRRVGVPTWIQIFASGACSAIYHGLQNFTLAGLLPSFILFSILAGIYVLGKRSITPTAIGHSMIHFLGDPYLTMLILAVLPK